jgi:hypothetical protein
MLGADIGNDILVRLSALLFMRQFREWERFASERL